MSWRLRHPSTVVSRWLLQSAAGVITPDAYGRYPGTLVNAPTWGVGPKNSLQCIELDGDDAHVNVGDVTQLNAVSQFTLAFWMWQDVLDISDYIFVKSADVLHNVSIETWADGNLYVDVGDGVNSWGRFDYSTVISARNWHHIAVVFDGLQIGDANRLVIYVDGIPVTLNFTLPIPAATADMAGVDATIGFNAASFDGCLWDFRLYSVALTRDEVNRIIHEPAALF